MHEIFIIVVSKLAFITCPVSKSTFVKNQSEFLSTKINKYISRVDCMIFHFSSLKTGINNVPCFEINL